MPHEQEIEETGVLRPELHAELKAKAIEAGLYAANMPADVGGCRPRYPHLGVVREGVGPHGFCPAFSNCVGRPSNILCACEGEQRERYLFPSVRGERVDCLAMTEPGAGSDVRGMKTSAVEKGGDYVINGTKHFISHADHADFVILFAATGEEAGPRGTKKLITAFLVDKGTPGFEVRAGYRMSHARV
jgi:acyl-CoA dehydrogenase